MFKIEKELGVKTSYYFRISTIDIRFMQEINEYGSEASYHFEELATYAKLHRIKDAKNIYKNLGEIQGIFEHNIIWLREKSGLKLNIVASHGDFVNRYLKIPNHVILDDLEFRNKIGIELEVYDDKMMKYVVSRHSDTNYPAFWKPDSPFNSIKRNDQIIYILTHPRHWKSNFIVNLKDDVKRFFEGIKYL